MNAEQIENQEIWKQVKNSEKLFKIYTYYPTLHDAKIRKIELNLENKEFYLTVDYSDLIGDSNESIETRITICWRNVQNADFNWYSEDLGGIELSKDGDFIKTILENSPYDFEGELISEEIEVVNVEVKPEKPELNTIKFSIE